MLEFNNVYSIKIMEANLEGWYTESDTGCFGVTPKIALKVYLYQRLENNDPYNGLPEYLDEDFINDKNGYSYKICEFIEGTNFKRSNIDYILDAFPVIDIINAINLCFYDRVC